MFGIDDLAQAKPDACAIVIFGASGDLAARKLLPALFRLHAEGLLNERSYILGVARTELDDESFRVRARNALETSNTEVGDLLARCFYQISDYDDADAYKALAARLLELDRLHAVNAKRMFYFATPPQLAMTVIERLGESGLSHEKPDGWVRAVLEKPFGSDLASARQMNKELSAAFRESQIYRIDHYLGKETVQNLLVFRFANTICEPIWNRNYIDHVQITVAETDGVGRRAGYFDQTGLLRDMVQNHLLQLLCLTAMEPPCTMEDCSMRDEKTRVLGAVKPFVSDNLDGRVVRGQYASGRIGPQNVIGYREEAGIAKESLIETFIAMRLELDNWRWQGVPFYLRAGKRLERHTSDIVVQFKAVPTSVLRPLLAEQLSPNLLRFRLQPEEGIELRFEAKAPGPRLRVRSAALRFDYVNEFGGEPPEAYARLLLDVMQGHQALFLPQEWIEHAWRVLEPVMELWRHSKHDLSLYSAGSWGPQSAEQLLERDGRAWTPL
ncbi:MAG: glucose-6-phosphate dehydrogenase [Steroidobacteraceae bacterium]